MQRMSKPDHNNLLPINNILLKYTLNVCASDSGKKARRTTWFRRQCSSYVGIAKDAVVAPPKALRVYSNGPSKRAVGEARL